MPYLVTVNEMDLHMVDDEQRERRRTLEINSIFTQTDDIADAFALSMRGTVDRYAYRQKQVFNGALEIGTLGDVNDKTNLVFLNDRREKQVFPVYDLEQSCFIATTGAGARIVKPKETLELAVSPTPEYYLNLIIDWVLDGTILVAGDVLLEYVEGYKAD